MKLESFIAGRYLKSKRKEVFISIITVISILGVAVSVMVLNIVLSVMTGFEKELQAKLLDTTAHITVRHFSGELQQWREARERILTVAGIKAVEPYTYNQALVSTSYGATGILIRGVENADASREKIGRYLEGGADVERLFNSVPISVRRPDGTEDEVQFPPLLVGRALVNRLGLRVNEPVSLFSPQMASSPQGLIPKLKRFAVIGSYHSGLVEYESGLAYTNLEAAQKFFAMGEAVSGLEVTVADPAQAIRLAGDVREALGGLEAPFEVTDWTVPNKPLWDALRLEKRVYFIVLLLLILIASFSIISTLIMVVMEKGKDIAILKTMGMADRRVLRIFFLQGVFIGAAGTVLGTLLGYLGCIALREYGFKIDQTVFSMDKVPVHIIPSNFMLVAAAAFVITSLAGIYPARRAARLRPADALRYE